MVPQLRAESVPESLPASCACRPRSPCPHCRCAGARTAHRRRAGARTAIAAAQAPVPAVAVADDHAALIARMRQAAHVYSQGLEDFLCTKITTRSGDRSGAGSRWKPLDVEESEVRYVEHKETETLLKVNGQSTNLNIKQGYFIPGGEFGASLLQIFSSSVHAQFTFDHQESAGSQQLCVFRYRVPFETSHWGMSDGTRTSVSRTTAWSTPIATAAPSCASTWNRSQPRCIASCSIFPSASGSTSATAPP